MNVLRNPILWGMVEREITRLKLEYGEIVLHVKVQDGVAIHVDITQSRTSYRHVPNKPSEELI